MDLLKDAQIISDHFKVRGTVSERSQLIGKEIYRRIMDVLYSMDFVKSEQSQRDEEVVECNQEPVSYSLQDSCGLNSKKEQKDDSTLCAEKVKNDLYV